MAHPSGPMAALRAVYIGSRSMRAGICWLLAGFCDEVNETLMVLLASTGVERLMDGRLNAAGLISTMVGCVVCDVVELDQQQVGSDTVGERDTRKSASGPSRAENSTCAT